MVEIDPHLSSTKKITKRPIRLRSAIANLHEPTKRFHVATDVATPTIFTVQSHYRANDDGQAKSYPVCATIHAQTHSLESVSSNSLK
jgi:hypothetical protein